MCKSSNLEIFMEHLRPEALMSIGRHWSLHSGCLPMEEARTEGLKRIPLLLLTELFPFKSWVFSHILGVSSHAITKPRELTSLANSYITIHSKLLDSKNKKNNTSHIFPPKFGKNEVLSKLLPPKSPFKNPMRWCIGFTFFQAHLSLLFGVAPPWLECWETSDRLRNNFGPTKNPETKRRCQWKRSIFLKGDTSEKMVCFSIVMLVLGSVFWENYHDLMTCLMWWKPQICSPYSFNVVTTVTGRDDDAAGIVFPDRFSQRVAPTFRRPLFGITWLGFLVTFQMFKDGWYE